MTACFFAGSFFVCCYSVLCEQFEKLRGNPEKPELVSASP